MDNLESYRPLERFSDRAVLYADYRPSYPAGVLDHFKKELALQPGHVIADIGAGTGLFAKPFLENGNRVICVEPNGSMREQGQKYLKGFKDCAWSDGKAESTMLKDKSVDFITCAQSFHWFHPDRATMEFRRVGRPKCITVLIWNTRLKDSSPFMKEYELLLHQHGKEYDKISDARVNEEKISLFFGGRAGKAVFPNGRALNYTQFIGRAFSSSYMPASGTPEHEAAEKALALLFNAHQKEGCVTFDYETRMYYGRP